MSFLSRSFHRTLAPVFLLAALLAPFPLAAWPATAPFGETIRSFVQYAYAGVGISPSCQQLRDETDTLKSLLPTSSMQFEDEARHFVSTLIETESSYTMQPPFFEETPYYSCRNPIPSSSTPLPQRRTGEYVTDLYHAFLQRDPDPNGLTFWTANADSYQDPGQGRRAVIDAFGTIPADAEFTQLVHSLATGLPVCCPMICPPGTHYDCSLNDCVVECTNRFCPQE